MMVLITYDVCTSDKEGPRRLRNISKICINHGLRVQNSVFECDIDPALWVRMKAQLLEVYEESKDSLRFYFLGSEWQRRVEHFGVKDTPDIFADTLVF